jgi:hypothetical protein
MNLSTPSGYITDIVERGLIPVAAWNDFIAQSPQGAPYGYTWYLDAVWPGWKGIIVYHQQTIMAVMPLKVSRKFGISYTFNPPWCQYAGVFFGHFDKRKTEQVLALKKRIVKAIVEAIPPEVKVFILNFAPEFDYPLPFHWAGYELHTRYSYWLDHHPDKQKLFQNLNERTRTYINKAKKSGLSIHPVKDIGDLLRLAQKKEAYSLNVDALKRLWVALEEHQIGSTLEIRDTTGRLHAGLIYFQQGGKLFHLFSASDPELNHFGGMSLALWHSIEQAGEAIKVIDFEGSMIEPVEHFFRGFGGRPVAYLQIKKNKFPKPFQWLIEK